MKSSVSLFLILTVLSLQESYLSVFNLKIIEILCYKMFEFGVQVQLLARIALIRSTWLQLVLMCSIFCCIFHCWIITCLRDFFFFNCSFLRVTAVSYQNKSLSYTLPTNPSGLFSIDQATGDISLTRSVDYESDQRQYLLLVRAEENEQFSGAAEVGFYFRCSLCLYVFVFFLSPSQALYRFPIDV